MYPRLPNNAILLYFKKSKQTRNLEWLGVYGPHGNSLSLWRTQILQVAIKSSPPRILSHIVAVILEKRKSSLSWITGKSKLCPTWSLLFAVIILNIFLFRKKIIEDQQKKKPWIIYFLFEATDRKRGDKYHRTESSEKRNMSKK